MWYTYILLCKDGSFYCGITNDLQKRLAAHNSGQGSKYVHSRGGGEIVFKQKFKSKSKALKREVEIKKLNRIKKELLIQKDK